MTVTSGQPLPPYPPQPDSVDTDIVSGIALGCFVGVLLGLSLTPGTTSTVVTALVAILASFFGLATTSAVPIQAANSRIAAFCFSAIIATLGATFVRTHDMLSPKTTYVAGLYNELKELGYDDSKAREMIANRYFSSGSSAPFPGSGSNTQTGTNKLEFPKE